METVTVCLVTQAPNVTTFAHKTAMVRTAPTNAIAPLHHLLVVTPSLAAASANQASWDHSAISRAQQASGALTVPSPAIV